MEGLSDQLFRLVAEALQPEWLTRVLLSHMDDGKNRDRTVHLVSSMSFQLEKGCFFFSLFFTKIRHCFVENLEMHKIITKQRICIHD